MNHFPDCIADAIAKGGITEEEAAKIVKKVQGAEPQALEQGLAFFSAHPDPKAAVIFSAIVDEQNRRARHRAPPIPTYREHIDSLTAGLPAVIPIESPPDDWIVDENLLECFQKWSKQGVEQRRDELTNLMTPDLCRSLNEHIERGARVSALLEAQELTRRGVPPMLRRIFVNRESASEEARDDLLTYDLEWLATTYPKQLEKTEAKRRSSRARNYRAVFRAWDTELFLVGIAHILSESHHYEPWDIAADLQLTDKQQWECRYIHTGEIGRAKRQIFAKSEPMRDKLAERENGARCGRQADYKAATVKRRHDIWFCSEIAGRGNPTEVARLYRAMTGDETMTKQIVARQLDIIPQRITKQKN